MICVHESGPREAQPFTGSKLLPFWDPLRGDSRFEQFVQSLAPK